MITYSNVKAYNQIWSPMGRYPMIDNSIFETYTEALTFATTSAVAVVGNIIAVTSDSDDSKNGVYVLIGEGKLSSSSQPTGLKKIGSDIDLSNYVTKDQLTNIYTYKGSKATFAELPVVDVAVGDVWNVEESYDGHAAGTNWVWNGSEWDALAGSIDLSGYALKTDVENDVKTINEAIAANSGSIATLQTSLSSKVDAVEGSSLISEEKLALIDTNAGDIALLKTADSNFETRLQTIEGAFKGEGGEIDLGDITTQLSEQGSKITALETDNTTNKSNISALQTQANGHGERLTAIETLNTEQSTQISGLTTRVENVEKHGEAITNLTTTVNGHTQDISDIKSSISGLAVKSVASEEKVLAADANGALSTTIKLGYDAENKKIQLKGISDAIVDELDATVFVKDGMLSEASYDTATKEIVLTWNTDAGKEATRIPMSSLVDTYTAGSGLKVENNEFAVKLDDNANNKLTVSASGLLVDISSDIAALEDTMDNKIEAAFSWQNVE